MRPRSGGRQVLGYGGGMRSRLQGNLCFPWPKRFCMRILLLDNYDSFSHILFQYLWEIMGEEPLFIRNDEWSLEQLRAAAYDALVISPGPGHPGNPRDFGICGEALRGLPGKPVLGIC